MSRPQNVQPQRVQTAKCPNRKMYPTAGGLFFRQMSDRKMSRPQKVTTADRRPQREIQPNFSDNWPSILPCIFIFSRFLIQRREPRTGWYLSPRKRAKTEPSSLSQLSPFSLGLVQFQYESIKTVFFCTQSFLVCITSHHLLDFLKSKFEIIGFIFGQLKTVIVKILDKILCVVFDT